MDKVLKSKIRKRLIAEYGDLFSKDQLQETEIKKALNEIVNEIIRDEHLYLSEADRKLVMDEVIDEFMGFGPIANLLNDPEITEIMINGPQKVYVETKGKKELAKIVFDDDQQLQRLIYKILAPTRRHVDEANPYTDVSLPDGSRVNIVVSPLALDGAVITIRKFLSAIKNIDDLLARQTLDKRMAEFLVASIKAKINIVIGGATGSGKTTTLGALSTYIENDERVITIEDTPELHLYQEHVVRLETRQSNIEGKGEVTTRDLFKNSLRMRPERIILGEIRGAEALDMLQAICSGHTGSLAILHANSPQDTINRIETMILTSGMPISLEVIHRQVSAAVHLIIQQDQLVDGSRKITHITQVNGLKDGRAVLEDIFYYDIEEIDAQGKVHGRWKATGVIPAFYAQFKKHGINLPQEIFNKD